MIIETVTLTYPDDRTDSIVILSKYLHRLRDRFVAEGKLLKFSTTSHGRVRSAVRIFRDAEAHAEWHADPLVQARMALHRDYFERNNITVMERVETI